MRSVSLLPEAVLEVGEAASWYESQRKGLGHEFRDALKRSLEIPQEGLVTGSTWPGYLGERGVKRIRIARFPYQVAFVGNEQDVVVLAVAHQRRRPGYWRERMK